MQGDTPKERNVSREVMKVPKGARCDYLIDNYLENTHTLPTTRNLLMKY